MNPLSVSTLNEQIKTLLESSFVRVFVQGELSRITYHNSGHIYFTLKDSDAAVRCVMFRGNASKLRFRLEEGQSVVVEGAVTVYTPRGEYQINCFMIEPAGHGALALAYEQLKQKLSQKGYFASEHKKTLPKFPRRIALITSATGAALQDMIRVANQRYRLVEIDVYDVLVQGQSSAASIVTALQKSDVKGYDVIVIGRGGGSMEDLWSFNEEIVADAVYNTKTPIVSAVGHEIDWVISDFVADVRAPTPSAAMQMILPDANELYQYIDGMREHYDKGLEGKIATFSQSLLHLKKMYEQHSIEERIRQKKLQVLQQKERFAELVTFKVERLQQNIEPLVTGIKHQLQSVLAQKQNRLQSLQENLLANHPNKRIVSGFAQVSRSGQVVSLKKLQKGEHFDLMDDTVRVSAVVEETKKL
jgi:exodeoxyribonuclease VII large subunit